MPWVSTVRRWGLLHFIPARMMLGLFTVSVDTLGAAMDKDEWKLVRRERTSHWEVQNGNMSLVVRRLSSLAEMGLVYKPGSRGIWVPSSSH